MQMIGFVLLGIALLATIVGIVQRRKGKKILATPFKRTGEIAANPRVVDAAGNVSCEGAVQLQAPAIAPVSGRPCLYYEVELIQEWTKAVTTEDGVKHETGRSTVSTAKSGVVFYVNDGSGPIGVDPRHGLDVELDKSFEQEQSMGFGEVQFGGFRAHVPPAGEGKSGKSVKIVERIVPADGRMFVLGRLDEQRNITKSAGLTGNLMASRKGRSDLLGKTKRNATIGFVAGALFMLPGGALAAFGEPMNADALSLKGCQILDESAPGAPCTGKIYGDYGSDVTFTVTKAATFEITGAPPAGKKLPLIPKLDVKDATGKVVAKDANAVAKVDLQPGVYTVNIRDSIAGAAKNFKGGFSYELSVKRLASAAATPVAPPATPTPTVLPASAAADPATTEAPAKKGKGKKGKKGGGKKTASAAKAKAAG
jgi:hypothetical protein